MTKLEQIKDKASKALGKEVLINNTPYAFVGLVSTYDCECYVCLDEECKLHLFRHLVVMKIGKKQKMISRRVMSAHIKQIKEELSKYEILLLKL